MIFYGLLSTLIDMTKKGWGDDMQQKAVGGIEPTVSLLNVGLYQMSYVTPPIFFFLYCNIFKQCTHKKKQFKASNGPEHIFSS